MRNKRYRVTFKTEPTPNHKFGQTKEKYFYTFLGAYVFSQRVKPLYIDKHLRKPLVNYKWVGNRQVKRAKYWERVRTLY